MLKKHGAFMFAFYLKNEKKRRLYLSGRALSALVPSPTGPSLLLVTHPQPTFLPGLPSTGPFPSTTLDPFFLAAKKPDITPEQRKVFLKAAKHMGMDKSKIIFFDWKKVNEEAVRYDPSSAPSVSDPRGSERASFWLRQLSEAGILLTLLPPVRAESHRDPRWAVSLKKVRLSRRF